METNNISEQKAAAIREAWRRGSLSWKLDQTQKELYDLFYNSKHKIMTWLLSRRQGKTYTLCILALEQCISKPNSRVKFVAPTKTQISMIVKPIFRQILEDCPLDIKPEFKRGEYLYYFPNGSEIHLAGTDGGHAEKLRGGDSDIFFVDEAGSCSDLDNLIKSILLPTTLITKGKGVLASTPPRESDHDFLKYIEDAEHKGSLITKTIDDNPRISKEQKDELIVELGGIESDECQRELYCKLIKDSKTSVLPEFDEKLADEITKDWPRPPFFDIYEAMDTGGKDLTVILYGYYDFRADKVIIEDETVINFQNKDETIEKLVKEMNKKEKTLFSNKISGEYMAPYSRVSDIDYIFTQEIYNRSKEFFPLEEAVNFKVANKDNNDAALNTLRMMLANRKIIIHPRCQVLLRHLKNVKWNSQKTKFARSVDDGHYDAVDALKYFVRHVAYNKNPYPPHYNLDTKNLFVRNPDKFVTQPNNQLEIYKRLFMPKTNKRRY